MTRKKKRVGPVWGYATHPEAEHWQGVCATKEEAVSEGATELLDDEPGEFWVVEGKWFDPTVFFDVDYLLERANETLSENAPEDAEFEFRDGAEERLRALVKRWAAANVQVDMWQMTGKPVRIVAKANGSLK